MQTYSMHIAVAYFSISWLILLALSYKGLVAIESDNKRALAEMALILATSFIMIAFLVPLFASKTLWR